MPQEKHKVRIERIACVAEGVRELTLVSESQSLLPAFTPGAHADLHLPDGTVRAYSLTNASQPEGTPAYVMAVGLSATSRGGSRFIHESLREGDVLEVGAPRNLFELTPDPAPLLLIAGGIGITPLRAMARQRQAQGLPWRLVYAARSRRHAAYADELALFGDRVRFHFDDEAQGHLPVAAILAGLPADTHVYCCGPAPLMDSVRAVAKDHPADRLHFESFGGQPAASDAAGAQGFRVELARQGRTVDVGPGQSIIDCLEACGVVVPSVCREGVCGACECAVLEGEIDHRDQILSDAEKQSNQTMMICVSRARGERLVLDV